MKKAVVSIAIAVVALGASGETATLSSPSKTVSVTFEVSGDGLFWSLSGKGRELVARSRMGLDFAQMPKLGAMKVAGRCERAVDEVWRTALYRKAEVHDRCNELEVALEEIAPPEDAQSPRRLNVVFRAYDGGAAFRYVVPEQDGFYGFCVAQELTEWRFLGGSTCWATEYKDYKTSQEQVFEQKRLCKVPPASIVGMPLIVRTGGQSVALCEAALTDWAGLFYRVRADEGTNAVTVVADLTPLPPPHASTKGGPVIRFTPAESPWRVAICGDDELDLLRKNDIIANLNPPPDPSIDFSWVKPGASSWDWWVDSNNSLSTELTLRLIDFAAEMGWPYHTIDGGWYGFTRRPNYGPSIRPVPRRGFDLDRILAHAKEKGVGIWVWANWQVINDNGIEETFADFERRGIRGVKIDFLDRQDQWMVQWYGKVLRAAARHRIMVNFHGAFKPTGTERTWPHNLTREGIRGNEMSKFEAKIDAVHTATLPFTRYLLGPGDFTPGSFANVHAAEFVPQSKRGHRYGDERDRRPIWAEEIGTRAHAIALCIAYDSPLMTLCDWPERYRGAKGIDALKALPTTWRETRPICGEPGSHYAVLRETYDGRFYFAALTVKGRTVSLPLDFLGAGKWTMRSFSDDPAATPSDAKAIACTSRTVSAGDSVDFSLVDEGGAVAIFERCK